MRRLLTETWGRFGRLTRVVGPVAIVNVALAGCGHGHFWDDVTRNDLTMDQRFKSMWEHPDPLVVLRDSQDGDLRARALRSLQEPKAHGGSDKEQETVVTILVNTAKGDSQPLCRLSAIQTLGHFKDPRAAQALVDAYYKATFFAPETATVIQCEALKSLGETKDPAGLDLLTRVVRAPKPALDVPDADKQQEKDRRIAAARALGNFHDQRAEESLVYLMKTEKDVALRDRAYDSLVQATGKKLANDPKAWEQLMAGEPPPEEKKISLTNWIQKH